MNRPHPPRQVPTLTEVVRVDGPDEQAASHDAPAEPGAPSHTEPVRDLSLPGTAPVHLPTEPVAMPALPAFLLAGSEEQIAHRVLTDLQRQIDMMLEYRLREALTPALARMSEQLIRETRIELADTLRDVIARAVAQELARMRSGS